MRIATGAVLAALLLAAGLGRGEEKAVDYKVHSGHFQKNTAKLKGDSSYLVLGDRKAFDAVFGVAFTAKKPNSVPRDAFDKGLLVAAVIKRGKAVTTYNVEKVTLEDGTLKVRYKATSKPGGGSARFASPLILTVPRKGVTAVEFVENGKKVDTVKVGK
jgi:hypothetical protein